MGRFLRIFSLTVIFTACGLMAQALAQTVIAEPSGPFSAVEKSDWARAWIDYLFHAVALPDGLAAHAVRFAPMADGLRRALGLYNVGILIIAGLLLFYHIVAMVAETAHHGTPFGPRANPVWMPLRFVLAIGLLVPVSSHLSAGQYIVLKIAQEGSALASNGWRLVAGHMDENFTALATPRAPNTAHVVAAAVEMETCRLVYQKLYTSAQQTDPTLRLLGNVGDVTRIPADRFSEEIWRASNTLNAGIPMCGEFRFSGYRRPLFLTRGLAAQEDMAGDLLTFARVKANELMDRVRPIAMQAAPFALGEGVPANGNAQRELENLISALYDELGDRWRSLAAPAARSGSQILASSAEGGWLAAALFIPELVRLQAGNGELFTHALPVVQEPVFVHPAVARQVLLQSFEAEPGLYGITQNEAQRLIGFYDRVSRTQGQVRKWLYGSQLSEKDYIPPSGFDLRDRLNAATDSAAAFSLLAQALDAAAMAQGVWGVEADRRDTAYPFAIPAADAGYNPVTALAEFGRRQYELASYLAGLAGGAFTAAGAVGPAALAGAVSLLLFVGGLGLVFIVPLLPFWRFLMAALGWAINVFEGVASVPIVALAHLTPSGEGLSGGTARQAYLLWLGLLVRPLMIMLGLIVGFLLFTAGLAFLNIALMPFARLATASGSGLLVTANVGLVLLYDVLAYAVANAAFKGIDRLPDQALRWISPFVVTDAIVIRQPAGSGQSSALVGQMTSFLGPRYPGGGTAVRGGPGGRADNVRSESVKTALFPAHPERPPSGTSPAHPEVSVGGNSSVTGAGQTSGTTGRDIGRKADPKPSAYRERPLEKPEN